MGALGYALLVLAVLIAADRVLLWAERRGWVTYRRSPRIRHSAGSALLEMEAFFHPSRRHVIEMREAERTYREEDDEAGGPPSPGSAARP